MPRSALFNLLARSGSRRHSLNVPAGFTRNQNHAVIQFLMSHTIRDMSSTDAPSFGSAQPKRFSADDDDEASYKRRRTSLACNSCRSRKSRCNGERPVCSTCSDMGFQCVYRRPAAAPKLQAQGLAYMQTRLQTLEELVRSIAAGQKPDKSPNEPAAPQNLSKAVRVALQRQETSTGASGTWSGQSSVPHEDAALSKLPMAGEDTVDGLGIITFADESMADYFGPSSNSFLLGQITRALAAGTGALAEGREYSDGLTTTVSRPHSPARPFASPNEKLINKFILPPRNELHRLVEIFFAVGGIFFPFLYKRRILEMIKQLDTANAMEVRSSCLCLLNAILALGASYDTGRNPRVMAREAESDVFFQRALSLFPWTTSDAITLETIQALAVVAYLQGTSRSRQTWKLHGLLIQGALQMGLHTTEITGKLSVLDQEIRTRTWFACICLDRVLSTAFGRPPLIHNDLIRMDLPRDVELDQFYMEDHVDLASSEPIYKPSSCLLFIANIKLYKIQGDIIQQVYDQNIPPSRDPPLHELLARMLRLDHDLNEWTRELHPSLTLVPVQSLEGVQAQGCPYTKSQIVVTVRYFSVRLLLYRRLLSYGLERISIPRELPEPNHLIVQEMLHVLIETASRAITLIRAIASHTDRNPSWWFSSYHVFMSALVVFGAICLQTLGQSNLDLGQPAKLLEGLQAALDVLDTVGKETRVVRRCSKCLKKWVLISSILVENCSTLLATGTQGRCADDNLMSTTDESGRFPSNEDMRQFWTDEDFNFLDLLSDLAQHPVA
ncbi:hypothetical protein ACJZ2D_016710 [Fusarium nematophilum]